MEFHDKKMAVFKLLNQEPIALRTILDKLGSDFNERTVRRWLFEWEKAGLIEKLGQKKASKYRLKTEGKKEYKEERKEAYFGPKSRELIEKVRMPIYMRDVVTYNESWLQSYIPNDTFYMPQSIQLQLRKSGERTRQEDPAGTYARQIFNRLLIDLSYNSSRLEGNTYSLLDTEKLLLQGKSAEGKLDEEAIMILNHKEAIRYLVDNAQRLHVSLETICTLHFLLSEGLVEPHLSGKVRDHSVRIGGSSYLPLEGPKKLQAILLQIVEKAALIQDPYEQSLFLLIHISYLQAFTDVNKRTARLSANISLIKNNLVPLSFNDVSREDYISCMIAIYEFQDVLPLMEMYRFSYLRTCAQYDMTVQSIGFDEVRVRYRQQRRALLRNIIIQHLKGNELENYIQQESKFVKEEERKDFIQDIYEDLKEMDEIRMVGLGITREQLKEYMELC